MSVSLGNPCGVYSPGALSSPTDASDTTSRSLCSSQCGNDGFKFACFFLEATSPQCSCVNALSVSPGKCGACDSKVPDWQCGLTSGFNQFNAYCYGSTRGGLPKPTPSSPTPSSPSTSPSTSPSSQSPSQSPNPSPSNSPSDPNPNPNPSPNDPGATPSQAVGTNSEGQPTGTDGSVISTSAPVGKQTNTANNVGGGTMVVLTETVSGRVMVQTSYLPGTSNDNASSGSSGLSLPVVLGIVGGVILIAIIAVIAIVMGIRRRKRDEMSKADMPSFYRSSDLDPSNPASFASPMHQHQPIHVPVPLPASMNYAKPQDSTMINLDNGNVNPYNALAQSQPDAFVFPEKSSEKIMDPATGNNTGNLFAFQQQQASYDNGSAYQNVRDFKSPHLYEDPSVFQERHSSIKKTPFAEIQVGDQSGSAGGLQPGNTAAFRAPSRSSFAPPPYSQNY
ncbi:hypothetical protein HDU97_007939 [Phlyctochytrium planicorne]|nr:hypothetical protein HDU97_007939 [Phlyctochytrium planicorne]